MVAQKQLDRCRALANSYQKEMIDFAQQLVQTRSPSGEEGEVARLVEAKMKNFPFEDVWTDRWGNVIGVIQGEQTGKSVMFNAHMDHVDPGNPVDWPVPPFSGKIQDGKLWGRGSADMKAPLAAMLYAVGILGKENILPPGDVYLTAVVQEEVGGFGTHHVVQNLQTDWAVVGEASANHVARGHRGRVEVIVQINGKSVHASAPQKGVNPLAVLVHFLDRVEKLELAPDDVFGGSTATPTLVYGDNQASNVIPNQITLHIDWRNIPGESAADVIQQLQPLLDASTAEVPGSRGTVQALEKEFVTWTGESDRFQAVFPSYCLEENHPLISRGRTILQDTLSHPVEVILWPFATDGGHLMRAEIPVLGFGPSQIDTLHTVREHISVEMLTEGFLGYLALACTLGDIETKMNA